MTAARRQAKRAARPRRSAAKRGVAWPAVRALALSYPGVAEGRSYGEPAFLLDGKFFSRFNEREQGLVVYAEDALRDALLAERPDVYFTTDHYRGYPMLLVRLARVPRSELAALYEAAFRMRAKPKRLAELDARRASR